MEERSKYYELGQRLGQSGNTSDGAIWEEAFAAFGNDLTEEIADEIRSGVAAGWRMYQEANWVSRYTTAPEAYDGFGTTALGVVAKMNNKQYRKVLIDPKHLKWQEMRYASGMCACCDAKHLLTLEGLPAFEFVDRDAVK